MMTYGRATLWQRLQRAYYRYTDSTGYLSVGVSLAGLDESGEEQ